MRLVDLFCGCGGFSLGAHQAGFNVKAAFDIDPILTSSYRFNFPETNLHLRDVATLTGREIEEIIGGKVEGVFGGPPCQGFSSIGLRDVNDPRRRLLLEFFRLIDELRPAFFVMENVQGLAHKNARPLLDEGIARIADKYTVTGPIILDAADFGAATSRKRLFVLGFDIRQCPPVTYLELLELRSGPATVRDAIGDLANAVLVDDQEGDFDVWRIEHRGQLSSYANSLQSSEKIFTGHRKTAHKPDTAARFANLLPGKHDPVGRHYRLKWEGQCPTLRAGTGSDRGSFQSVRPIHPDEPRVITVREAARIQGFPDGHRFHPTVWHSFRMIGNSVSPIMSRAIFRAIKSKIDG